MLHNSFAYRILFFALLSLPLLNCGGARHGAEEKYVLVATNIKLEYWQSAGAGLHRAAAQLQVKADFVGPETYDPKAQQAKFREVVAQKPSGILISVADPALMKDDLDAAIAQGIPVITIDSDAPASKRLCFVGTDNYKAGVMGAQIAAKRLQGKGGVVMYTMPEQANLNDRLRGYRDTFAAYPQIKILETIDVHGDPRIAFDRTTEILEKGTVKPDGFICLEATACPEVAEVLERQRIQDKVVVAMDTDQRTLEELEKGVITATIGQKPFTMAFYGLKMLDDLHHHKVTPLTAHWAQDSFSPIPTFVDTGATLIDKGNVGEFRRDRQSATKKQ